MAAIFVYAPDAADFDTMGLCGSLTPTKCEFKERRNGISQLNMDHPIDDYGRWSQLVPGCILKAEVPVRTTPEIDGTSLVTTVEKWMVKTDATSGQRKLYSKKTGGRVIKTLPVWADKAKTQRFEVTVVRKLDRYKAKTKYGTGWISPAALEYSVTDTIGSDPAAIETVESAWTTKPQLFRIVEAVVSDKGVSVTASHIFYDLSSNITTWSGYDSKTDTNNPTCAAALDGVLAGCAAPHEFEGFTNMLDQRAQVAWTRTAAVEALLAADTGLIDLWGAELVRDNYEFYVLREAGQNRGVVIQYGKNLLGVECTTDVGDVIARIVPVGQTSKGKDLFLVPGTFTVNGTTVTIATGETWVTSPQAGDYAAPMMSVLDTGVKAKSGSSSDVAAARLKMIEAALNKFADDKCDQPSVNVKVTFVNLGDTVEYEQYKRLDDLFLCDRARVRHPGIGVDVLTEVIEVVWDCLTGQAKSIELGRVQLDRARIKLPVWQLPSGIPGTLVATGTLGGGALADGTVTDDQMADGAAVSRVIADEAIEPKHFASATIDDLNAGSITALTAKINEIVAGAITTDALYAALGSFVTLRAQRAAIGTITTDLLRAALATIATAVIDSAQINFANIVDMITQTALITKGVGGEFYFRKLAVTDANMLHLTVGALVVRGSNGKYYRVSVAADGTLTSVETQVDGPNIADNAVSSEHIVDESINTRHLDAAEIFGDEAIIRLITAGIINVGELFASNVYTQSIQANAVIRVMTLPENPVVGQSIIFMGVTPNEYLQWTGYGVNPTQRRYAASKAAGAVVINDLSDERTLSLLIKTVAKQASGTPSLTAPLDLVGHTALTVEQPTGTNLMPTPTAGEFAVSGVTFQQLSNGGYHIYGMATAAIYQTLVGAWNSGAPIFWLAPGTYILKEDAPASCDVVILSGTTAIANAGTPIFTLTAATPIDSVAVGIASGKTLDVYIGLQVEAGSTGTDYVRYAAKTTLIAPKATMWGLEGHEDRWGSDGGEAHYSGYAFLTGAESGWVESVSNAGATTKMYALPLYTTVETTPNVMYPGIKSNRLIDRGAEALAGGAYQDTGGTCVLRRPSGSNTYNLYVRVPIALCADLAAFRAWLATHSLQVVYAKDAYDAYQGDAVNFRGYPGQNILSSSGRDLTVTYSGSGWQRVGNAIVGSTMEINPDGTFKVAASRVELAVTNDDGDVSLSKIDEDGAYFPALSAPDVTPRWSGPYSLTVDPTQAVSASNYTSLAALADDLRYCYLDEQLTVTLAAGATLRGNAIFDGLTGAPVKLTSPSGNKATVVGTVQTRNAKCHLTIDNIKISGPAAYAAIYTEHTDQITVESCEINTTGTGLSIYIGNGCAGLVSNTGMWGGVRGLHTDFGGRATMVNCRGSSFSVDAARCSGGLLICAGTVPAAGTSGWLVSEYNGIVQAASVVASSGTATAPPAETTVTYQAVASGYYKSNWESGSDMRQGYTGYELTGCFWLDNPTVRAALAGKAIKDAKLALSRKSGYGVSGAVTIYLHGTTSTGKTGGQPNRPKHYGGIGTLKNGQAGTFALPVAAINDLVTGTINGYVLYAGDGAKLPGKDYSGNYGVFVGAGSGNGPAITVTY